AASLGVFLFNENSQRTTARLLGLAWVGFLVLAMLGIAWEPVARLGAAQLVVPALLFASLPAAHALTTGLGWLYRRSGSLLGPAAVAIGVAGLIALTASGPVLTWGMRLGVPQPLRLGLGSERTDLLAFLQTNTTSAARILWEDGHESQHDSLWTALLPLLTDRAFVGGLDPDAGIEHATGGLANRMLAGRPVREWS